MMLLSLFIRLPVILGSKGCNTEKIPPTSVRKNNTILPFTKTVEIDSKMSNTTETHRGTTFSFAEIVKGRDSSVRVSDDGLLLVAVDLAVVMTGLTRDQAEFALQWLPGKSSTIKFIDCPTIGGFPIKLITFEHAIELAMTLPCKVAKETRIEFANIIRRYLAGDEPLVSGNANSHESVAQLARDSKDDDGNHTNEIIFRKRGLEQDGLTSMMMVCDRKHKSLMQEIELKEKHAGTLIKSLDIQKTIIESYTLLCEDKVLDDEAKLLFKRNILELASQSTVGWDYTTDF